MKEYRVDLEIDQNDLDTACLKQPVLFDMYAQNVAVLSKKRDELKLMIEQEGARLDGILREAASAEGKKITEIMVQNEIVRNKQYADLQQKYLNLCSEVKEAEIVRDAFNQRKDMLKLLVELFISGYWSSTETKLVKDQRVGALKEKLEEKMKQDKQKNGIN